MSQNLRRKVIFQCLVSHIPRQVILILTLGAKFIGLIKGGKINVDSNFILTTKSADRIGVKDGLYVTDDGSVYLKVGNTILNLVGEIGTTYVSFLEEQETTSERKCTALQNIGFIYKDMNSPIQFLSEEWNYLSEIRREVVYCKGWSINGVYCYFPKSFY